MNVAGLVRTILPASAYESIVRLKKQRERMRIARLAPLSESSFNDTLTGNLGLGTGDVVFIHSSLDGLNLSFPFYRILALLREIVGPQGTLVFPTYPNRRISSYEYLLRSNIFDVRKTPSYVGLLTEFARRQPSAVRSLHPTKSVCAIGPLANDLTREHQNSPYPYDSCSPYYKLVDCEAKIVGLGTWTSTLSFTYSIADALKDDFPVRLYHDRIFAVPCVNYSGETQIVKTYVHNMQNIARHDAPAFMRNHIPPEVCADLVVNGLKFFRADARTLFDEMIRLAKRGITVYPRSAYAKKGQ